MSPNIFRDLALMTSFAACAMGVWYTVLVVRYPHTLTRCAVVGGFTGAAIGTMIIAMIGD